MAAFYADESAFRGLVERDMQDEVSEEERQYLRSTSDVVDRWHAELATRVASARAELITLNATMTDVQQTYLARGNNASARNAWFAYKAEATRKRARLAALAAQADMRLSEAKRLRLRWRRDSQLSDDALLSHLKRVAVERGRALAAFTLEDCDISDLDDEEEIELVATVGQIRQARAALRMTNESQRQAERAAQAEQNP